MMCDLVGFLFNLGIDFCSDFMHLSAFDCHLCFFAVIGLVITHTHTHTGIWDE
jgi:hypothetical protein